MIQHGGILQCESDGEGQGSTFTLVLPCFRNVSASARTCNRSFTDDGLSSIYFKDDKSRHTHVTCQDVGLPAPPLLRGRSLVDAHSKINILVVDDSRLNRKIVCRAIKALTERVRISDFQGFEIFESEDGAPALETVVDSLKSPENHIAFIIIDNIMLNMHGPEAVARMRAAGYSGNILALSGNVLESDQFDFFKQGANFFVRKPLVKSSLDFLLDLMTESVAVLGDVV